MKFTDLLQGIGSPIAFYPDLVPVVGSHQAAIFLCQLTYWTGKQQNRDGWIYKTQEEWFYETGLTEKEQRTARRPLIDRGYMEERLRGIPSRLEYRLKENALNEAWDVWAIAGNIKKQFQELTGSYGVLLSRGIQNEEIQQQMETFRTVIRKCHVIANRFFDNCRRLEISPLGVFDRLRTSLKEMAETIGKSTLSQRALLGTPNGNSKVRPTGTARSAQWEQQGVPNGSLGAAESLSTASVPAPSEITSKTTSKITPESVHRTPENTHMEGPPLETFKKEEDQELAKAVELEVLQDTQQQSKDQKFNSQGQNCIFMKAAIPGAGGGENFEKLVPIWVQEIEEKVRLGYTLPRSELLALAEYRLGSYANLYRQSGRVLDAGPNDLKPEFLRFLQWHSFNGNPDISYVQASINKSERNPEQWNVLLSWLQTWQQVQDDPSLLETMLSAKVSSSGKKGSIQDLEMKNRLNAEKAMTAENWWELV